MEGALEAARNDPVKGCPVPGGNHPRREATVAVNAGNDALSKKEGRELCHEESGSSHHHPRREAAASHYDEQGGRKTTVELKDSSVT